MTDDDVPELFPTGPLLAPRTELIQPWGFLTDGKVMAEDGQGLTRLLIFGTKESAEQQAPTHVMVMTTVAASALSQMLGETAAKTELQAATYRNQHNRKLANKPAIITPKPGPLLSN